MNISNISLKISFESLVEAVSNLDKEQKQQLWQILDRQTDEIEDEAEENNPEIQSEIAAAREAYEAGDYITLEEYLG